MSDKLPKEIQNIKKVLNELLKRRKVLLAYLYGSFANGSQHKRSDIDLAIYLNTESEEERIEIIGKIQMAADSDVAILRLDDEDESPFIIQEALKGIALIEPDEETLYKVSLRALHEAERIRFKRETFYGTR